MLVYVTVVHPVLYFTVHKRKHLTDEVANWALFSLEGIISGKNYR